MEQMGLGEGGCSVMQVVDCNSSPRSQNMLAMGAIMATIHNHHLVILVLGIFLSGLNCNIIQKQVQCAKGFIWLMFHG